MKTASFNLSYHDRAKQYVRFCGYSLSAKGKPSPHCFYLGNDKDVAMTLALRLKADWSARKARGGVVWDKAYLESFKCLGRVPIASGDPYTFNIPHANIEQPLIPSIPSLTVKEAKDEYLAEQMQRMEAKQIATVNYRVTVLKLNRVLETILDRQLRSIEEKDLHKIILHWASLPIGRIRCQTKTATTGQWVNYRWRRNAKKRTKQTKGKPISTIYAKNLLITLKAFFAWCHDKEYYDKCRRFDSLFKVKFKQKLTVAKRFNMNELKAIYNASNDRHKLWIVLSLNCGNDRMGLATVTWDMVKDLDTTKPYIERLRHKTQVYSKHSLWKKTAMLLRNIPQSERKGFICRTANGLPLYEQGITKDRDAIAPAWRHLIDRATVEVKPFGTLRKTGAWMIKKHSGLEASEMYLAHTEQGLNHHYADRNWDLLASALKAIEKDLSEVWD